MACLLEGIERYSIQYHAGDPFELASIGISGAGKIVLPANVLLLGHPAQQDGVEAADSRGCSVGRDLPDAALRGLLELAENDAVDRWLDGQELFHLTEDATADSRFEFLSSWAHRSGLALRIGEHRHVSGALVSIAVCSEVTGSRPAFGSAAGLDRTETIMRACLEAVSTWFNLGAIGRRGRELEHLSPEGQFQAEVFLGSAVLPQIRASPTDILANGMSYVDLANAPQTFESLVSAWGIEAAVFDLTRPATGVTAVRVVRLDR